MAVAQHVHAEARHAGDLVREVGVPRRIELGLVPVRHDGPHHPGHHAVVQHRVLLDPDEVTAQSQNGALTDTQVQVGGAAPHLFAEQRIHRGAGAPFIFERAERSVAGPAAHVLLRGRFLRVVRRGLLHPLAHHEAQRGRLGLLRDQPPLVVPAVQETDARGRGDAGLVFVGREFAHEPKNLLGRQRLLAHGLRAGWGDAADGGVGFENDLAGRARLEPCQHAV